MTRCFALSIIGLLGLWSCGAEPGLVQVEGVWPISGSRLSTLAFGEDDLRTVQQESVDVSQDYCASSGGEGDKCSIEPFTAHYAVVRIANRYPRNESDPKFGTVTLKGFSLTLSSDDDEAPKLDGQSGPLQLVFAAEQTYNITLPLVDLNTIDAYARRASNKYLRYGAVYKLVMADREALQAGTSVVLGNYNACPAETLPVPFCAVGSAP